MLDVAAADQLWFAARSPSLDFSLFLQLLGPADGPHGGQIIQSKRLSVTKSVEHLEHLILHRFFLPLDESGTENVLIFSDRTTFFQGFGDSGSDSLWMAEGVLSEAATFPMCSYRKR